MILTSYLHALCQCLNSAKSIELFKLKQALEEITPMGLIKQYRLSIIALLISPILVYLNWANTSRFEESGLRLERIWEVFSIK
ncbi:unnamed protein product [Moneuplotes crassus]|uniref:Uncharacterized protein n=1 Tax=Euplotes crassus TaxID=5936 RepID=A0AAD1UU46_EUPCR|nr:unnamed protein product [Moneuplotes crassus]